MQNFLQAQLKATLTYIRSLFTAMNKYNYFEAIWQKAVQVNPKNRNAHFFQKCVEYTNNWI